MRVAVVHYHLKPGGVTRVVCHAAESIRKLGAQTAVLAGDIPDSFPLKSDSALISALRYSEHHSETPADVIDEMISKATPLLQGAPDLWHIHNHSLGKNTITHELVGEMALRGLPLLLQIHDFSEDGRPSNMLRLKKKTEALRLYPIADHVHYGVLNGRDRNLLLQAGFPDRCVHFIPNPVQVDLEEPEKIDLKANRYFLYPTRAIRRKNVGEFLLWAAAAEEGDRFGLTLAPDNPEAKSIYEGWVALSNQLSLPVDFEVGKHYGFSDLLHAADWIMTTSIAEGFGLAFLEPGLIPRPVTGRDLPEITSDFRAEGIHLDSLYESIPIPLDALDLEALRTEIIESVKHVYIAYDQEFTATVQQEYLESLLGGGSIDFGILTERFQSEIIQRVKHKDMQLPEAPWIREVDQSILDHDKSIIQERYSRPAYGTRLLELYKTILESDRSGKPYWIPSDNLIRAFLKPEQFSLLRV